ncbi:PREDICTED: saccharopine dehydrogenase-like oxidoreductase isoform X2 [Papilio xuthus]|uniref:Saccharopine dehydrogenase-like oxidoreductase isoform X2 n=1 Tax=Papilio xuthus TaxID=66420 RepID=A0AAJ7E5P1_PAPXU|nr:PREDICTED: saccharopine dehydrogenase-like oxidoreductase isoform X2 [Papilio xuthus]
MSRLDLVIFGATGFTGKHAVMECARIAKKKTGLTWGIAGRSQSKLNAVLEEATKKTGEDLSSIPVLIADVGDEESLLAMCQRAKVLVNCCGPYRLYGEPVVAAAVRAKTHYVDVSGEPQFIETMQLRYDGPAREAGVYVISACGFDSIPNDLGVVFLEQNFEGTLNSVESYISTHVAEEQSALARRHGVVHRGTWESVVYGVTHRRELPALRKQLYPDRLPPFTHKLCKRSIHKKDGGWCVPFPGADSSIVYRSQRELHNHTNKRPVQFAVYFHFPNLLSLLAVLFVGFILVVFSMTKVTRNWLIDYPRLFSFGAVTDDVKEEVMDNTYFQMLLYGEGWEKGSDETKPPNKKMVAKVSGRNPGYGATVVALLHSALTLLHHTDHMPPPGGVLTTALAFRDTDLIQRLHHDGLKFEIIQK